MSPGAIKKLSCEDLTLFLAKHDLSEYVEAIQRYDVDGAKFLKLNELELRLWRPKIDVKKLWKFIADVNKNPGKYEESDLVVLSENRAPITKQQLSTLFNDDKFMSKLKIAVLSKKADNPVSSDDDMDGEIYENYNHPQTSEDMELYENTFLEQPERCSSNRGTSPRDEPPKLPAKPNVQPKVTANQKNQKVKDYLPPSNFDYTKYNSPSSYLKSTKFNLEKRPDLQLMESEMEEDYLEPNISRLHAPSRKPIPQQQPEPDLPEYLDMEPKKNTKALGEHSQRLPCPIPVEFDEPEPIKKPAVIKKPYPISAKSTEGNGLHRDNVGDRPPVLKQRCVSIKNAPLPPVPNLDLSTLPRPPKNVPTKNELQKLGFMTLEDFNFAQSFVPKYSRAKFYRYTDRKGAEELLSSSNIRDGTYLVRPSNKNYCALAVKYNDKVFQLAVGMDDKNRISQCGKEFKDLEEMIEYFKVTPMRFQNTSTTVDIFLTEPLPANIT